MATQRTQGKWEIEPHIVSIGGRQSGWSVDIRTPSHIIAENVSKEDAEYIVRAVNSHKQLVEALKEARKYTFSPAIVSQIDEALAAAESEEQK